MSSGPAEAPHTIQWRDHEVGLKRFTAFKRTYYILSGSSADPQQWKRRMYKTLHVWRRKTYSQPQRGQEVIDHSGQIAPCGLEISDNALSREFVVYFMVHAMTIWGITFARLYHLHFKRTLGTKIISTDIGIQKRYIKTRTYALKQHWAWWHAKGR